MKTYPPGYFTANIAAHDWPPRFTSQLHVDPKTRRYITPHALAQLARSGGGFDANPLGLLGAVPYIVNWEARK